MQYMTCLQKIECIKVKNICPLVIMQRRMQKTIYKREVINVTDETEVSAGWAAERYAQVPMSFDMVVGETEGGLIGLYSMKEDRTYLYRPGVERELILLQVL